MDKKALTEKVQHITVKLLATNPVGIGLVLIGGFRYRFLNKSCRFSGDIDYSYEQGELAVKRGEIIECLRGKLLPELKSQLGLEGRIGPAQGPEADSDMVKTAELVIYEPGVAESQIIIPLDITRIVCLDNCVPEVEGGTLYLTASAADMVESKIIALYNRQPVQYRDFIDVYLFAGDLKEDSIARLQEKLKRLSLDPPEVSAHFRSIETDRPVYIKGIQGVIDNFIDPEQASLVNRSGGAGLVFDRVMDIVKTRLHLAE